MGIRCCKDCVPPKRHVGCHSECKEYKDEKERFEAEKRWLKENKTPRITQYDFDEIMYVNSKRHKRRDRD